MQQRGSGPGTGPDRMMVGVGRGGTRAVLLCLTALAGEITLALMRSPEGAVVAGMFSYEVTATGPEGFQVSVTHPVHGSHLIGNFCSLQAAEIFAEDMREIDACPSHGAADYRIETLIRRNHELIAAAAKARSDIRETKVKANQARAQGRAMRANWQKRSNAEPEHPLVMFRQGLATRH